MKRDFKNKFKKIQDSSIKPLALVGLLAILGALIFSISSLGKNNSYLSSAAVSLSSVFTEKETGKEKLFVSADSLNQKSGEVITIFFKHPDSKAQGSYSFIYPCLPDFYFEAVTEVNGTEKVFCNIPFNFINTNNTIKIKAVSNSRYTDMPIGISFTPNGKSSPTDFGSITLSISNENTSSNENVAKIKTTLENKMVDEKNAKSDLKITIIETGILDKGTKKFIKSNSIGRNDSVAIRFAVENIGLKSSGPWQFNAILPTYPPRTFNSEIEPSLAPESRIEFTISFDQTIQGNQTVKFLVDPNNTVAEILENNNSTSVEIQIL